MKVVKILALAMAVLLLACGCNRRENEKSGASGMIPKVESKMEEGAENLRSDIEEGISRLEERSESMMEKPMESSFRGEYSLEEEFSELLSKDESAAPAMSADFSEIGALDGRCEDGFPGGPVDAQNRPSGPMTFQEKYSKYDAHFIVPSSKKIFLTFDEGYENGYTGKILDVLKEKGVKAVFFVTYPYAKTEQELMRRIIDEGHVLGNHSTDHKSYPSMPLQEAAKDLMNLHDYVKTTYGYEMYLFRPPEGKFSEQTLALAQSLGYKTMLWSFAYNDWNPKNQPITIEASDRIVSRAHPGEICLLHAVSKTNAEILGDVIDRLRSQGFEFSDYFYLSA